jgi:hypothetical protein
MVRTVRRVSGRWFLVAIPMSIAALAATALADVRQAGSTCQPSFGSFVGSFNYEGNEVRMAATGAGNPTSVTCPQTVDREIGQPHWFARVVDGSSLAGFAGQVTCFGSVYDNAGNIISTVSAATPVTLVGTGNLNYEITSGAETFQFAQYVSTCFLPFKQGANALSAIKYLGLD